MKVKLIAITQPLIEIDGQPLTPEGLIAYSARVSSPHQENPDYEKLLRYCIKHDHWCYDSDTEILTDGGFIPFPSLTFDHRVAAYDISSQLVKYEKPKEIYRGEYVGDLCHFETFSSDLMVTPNHRMLGVKRRLGTTERFYEDFVDQAENLMSSTFAIRSAVPENHNDRIAVPVVDSDRFFEFIGFFIGDGSCKGDEKYPVFNLRIQRKIDYLENLCEKLQLPIHKRKYVRVIQVEGFKQYALNFLYSQNGHKTFPLDWLKMSNSQFSYFLSGLMESDGSQASRKTNTLQYSTTSDELADRIQTLAVLNGFSCANKQRKRNDGYYSRDLMISEKQYAWIDKHRITKFGMPSRKKYSGNIYCCTTSTGMIVVRRNGKVSISGNSIFEQVDMTVEITTSRAIAAQILRHKSFSFQEFSQRYAEVMDYEICEARRQDLKNRQNSIDDLPENLKEWFLDAQQQTWDDAYRLYDKAIENGIAKECARMLLPLNTQTKLYMKGSIRSWIHYLQVRCATDTQKEHRDIATGIGIIFAERFPIVANAAGLGGGN